MNKIIPSENKHFKNIHTGDIYEGVVYLGIYDSADNYIEVTEEEYQEWLHRYEETTEKIEIEETE